jgi:hypothetical protein
MRHYPDDPDKKETYLEAGELIIWRWLGLDRFFPAGHEDVQTRLYRGISAVSFLQAFILFVRY